MGHERSSQTSSSRAAQVGVTTKTRQTRAQIVKHPHDVTIKEQPLERVWDLVDHVKRHHETAGNITSDATVLQTRPSLQAGASLLSCDLAILPELLTVMKKLNLDLDLTSNKGDCLRPIAKAQDKRQPAVEVEGHILFDKDRTFRPK